MKNSQQKTDQNRGNGPRGKLLAPNSPSSDTKTNIVDVLEFNSDSHDGSVQQYDSEVERF